MGSFFQREIPAGKLGFCRGRGRNWAGTVRGAEAQEQGSAKNRLNGILHIDRLNHRRFLADQPAGSEEDEKGHKRPTEHIPPLPRSIPSKKTPPERGKFPSANVT